MSIATEIQRIQQAKADIKEEINKKGVEVPDDASISDYSQFISQISSSGGNSFKYGGNNPILVGKEKVKFNLGTDTNIKNITPTTSGVSILNNSTVATFDNIDSSLYDYVIVVKMIIKCNYAWNIPSGVPQIKKSVNLDIYNLGDYIINPFSSKSPMVNQLKSESGISYINTSGNESFLNSSFYGIRRYSSYTPYYNIYGKTLRVSQGGLTAVISNGYMTQESYNYLDADNSEYEFEVEVWQIDKDTAPLNNMHSELIDIIKRGQFDPIVEQAQLSSYELDFRNKAIGSTIEIDISYLPEGLVPAKIMAGHTTMGQVEGTVSEDMKKVIYTYYGNEYSEVSEDNLYMYIFPTEEDSITWENYIDIQLRALF